MGFCFFNNAAVAAKWLRTVYGQRPGQPLQRDVNGKEIKMERILILDWDVHHGQSVSLLTLCCGLERRLRDVASFLYNSALRDVWLIKRFVLFPCRQRHAARL